MRTSNRRKILDAIIAIVERDGITAVTFDAVAAETGLTRGGLLYHFASKEALETALLERMEQLAREDVAEMEAEPEGELLRRAIRAAGGGHATLLRASAQARATAPAFEPEAPALAVLSARVKAMLDPANIFSPGKMGGF